ncbi:hypothetical protein F5Y14DRAFT_238859 [Nemania sp. NC0429]|nr:hypothetical protein F5Y14DRAFT_238859 [Nemania sp. NC0429]
MVGIPRSKGCKTCKRRKIKVSKGSQTAWCDEQKPACGPCRKGERKCEGYEQPTIFRHSFTRDFASSAATTTTTITTTTISHGAEPSQLENRSIEDVSCVGNHTARADEAVMAPRRKRPIHQRVHPYAIARRRHAESRLAGTVPLLREPDSMVWAVQSITGQFLETCLPHSESQEAPLSWLGEIKDMGQNIDALPLAMSALALGWAGRVDREPQLADKGLQLYSAAVRQLRSDMRTCSLLQSLAVTAIFVAFELCQFGSKGNPGRLAHMQGIAAFLQALGPESVSDGPYLKIYSFCRVVFIMQGLHRRRSVCAGSDMWMYGPFRNHEKNAYHLFHDLSARACGLLGHADGLSQVDEVENERAAQVLQDLLDLLSRLKKWVRDCDVVGFTGPFRFPSGIGHGVPRSRSRSRSRPESGWTFDTLYWQKMLYDYWTLRLDLYMTILDNPVLSSLLDGSDDFQALLRAGLETGGAEVGQVPSRLVFEEGRRLANNIAVTFTGACYSATCQSFGSLVAVYILETAIRWYERHGGGADAELEQHCRAMLDEIRIEESKDPFGFDVSPFSDQVLKLQWCDLI